MDIGKTYSKARQFSLLYPLKSSDSRKLRGPSKEQVPNQLISIGVEPIGGTNGHGVISPLALPAIDIEPLAVLQLHWYFYCHLANRPLALSLWQWHWHLLCQNF